MKIATILGLDPGINTGAAIFEGGHLAELLTIHPLDIFDLIATRVPARVVYEDSRLQSHVWTRSLSSAAGAKVARNVGEIDAWCAIIVESCNRLGIAAHGISPKGKGTKLNAAHFGTLTGWTKPSNQHNRDAAIVAWQYRGAA